MEDVAMARGGERAAGVGTDGEEGGVAEVEQAGEADHHVEAEGEQGVDRRGPRRPADELGRLPEDQRHQRSDHQGDGGEGETAAGRDRPAEPVGEAAEGETGQHQPHRVVGERQGAELTEERLLAPLRDQVPDGNGAHHPHRGQDGTLPRPAEGHAALQPQADVVVQGARDQPEHRHPHQIDQEGAHPTRCRGDAKAASLKPALRLTRSGSPWLNRPPW